MSQYSELLERIGAAKKRKLLMQNVYEDVMRLAIPNREAWNTRTEGRDTQRHVYSSTLQHGLERLTNALCAGMFPPNLPWVEFGPGSEVPEEDKDYVLAKMQEDFNKPIALEIAQSNFYAERHPWLANLCIGTGPLFIDEVNQRRGEPAPQSCIEFTSIPLEECGLEPGRFGKVEGLFREHRMTARQFMADFPDAEIPTKIADNWKKDPDNNYVNVHTCTYRELKGLHSWVQRIVVPEATAIVEERRFFSQPFVAPRWSAMSGEIFGRGPACVVSADAYSANEAARLDLIRVNLEMYGMFTSTDAGINEDTLEIGPGAIIAVNSNHNSDPTLKRLDMQASSGISENMMARLDSSIKQGLYRDNLKDIETSDMTATEVIERQALVAQDMGTAFGRINAEGTDIILSRIAEIMGRKGKIPELKVDGKEAAIKYVSPMARAQELEEVNAIREVVADATNMMQVDPGAGVRVNTGEALRTITAKRGAPMKILRSDEEVEEILTKQATAEQEIAQQQGA